MSSVVRTVKAKIIIRMFLIQEHTIMVLTIPVSILLYRYHLIMLDIADQCFIGVLQEIIPSFLLLYIVQYQRVFGLHQQQSR